VKYITFILLILLIAILLSWQTANATPTEYIAVALCPINTDCISFIEVYPSAGYAPWDILYWEVWQNPPDVMDWQPWPDNGVLETKALGIYVWSPDGVGFKLRLWGQQYKVRMPMVGGVE
jgi:hypothetical protein